MSSMGICALMVKTGLSMIQQIAGTVTARYSRRCPRCCGDGRNNILCLTGDGVVLVISRVPSGLTLINLGTRTLKTMRMKVYSYRSPHINAAQIVPRRSGKSVRTASRNTRVSQKLKRAGSFKPTTGSTSPDSSVSWMKFVGLGLHERVFIMPGGPWQAPRRRDGCGRT